MTIHDPCRKPLLDSNDDHMRTTKPRKKGHANEKFKKKHKLSSKSMPWDFADAFFPYMEDKIVPMGVHLLFKNSLVGQTQKQLVLVVLVTSHTVTGVHSQQERYAITHG